MASQVTNGKAFEYALLIGFYERLKEITSVTIVENNSFLNAKKCFEDVSSKLQNTFKITASTSVDFILNIEPRLTVSINQGDTLELEIAADARGQSGDVRDVLLVRSAQSWEIGISAKNNHKAVKHSRLSQKIDFGEKWMGQPCSDDYFNEIKPIFDFLSETKNNNRNALWSSIENMHQRIYVPILNAFKKELLKLNKANPKQTAENLVQYLIGHQDFYKVIRLKDRTEIQIYNIHGTLGQSIGNIKPKIPVKKLKLPTKLVDIAYEPDSTTTLIVFFDEGWQVSFRIHNASSRVEPSLKFDINLISTPSTLFTTNYFE